MKILLAYLVHCGPQGASKEQLLNFLWPDTPDLARLSSRFYATLSYLRRALEPFRQPLQASQLIAHEEGWCRLNHAACWVDVEAFERYCRQAQRWEHAGQTEAALDCWRMAVALYHGDYLADLASTWPGWSEDERYLWRLEQLREMYFTAVVQLAKNAERRGDPEKALSLAQHVLQQDITLEEACQVAMRALARLGRRDALVRQYQQFRRALRKWVELEPSSETVVLYRQLLNETHTSVRG